SGHHLVDVLIGQGVLRERPCHHFPTRRIRKRMPFPTRLPRVFCGVCSFSVGLGAVGRTLLRFTAYGFVRRELHIRGRRGKFVTPPNRDTYFPTVVLGHIVTTENTNTYSLRTQRTAGVGIHRIPLMSADGHTLHRGPHRLRPKTRIRRRARCAHALPVEHHRPIVEPGAASLHDLHRGPEHPADVAAPAA